jgi:cell division transport system ATP-binding protein
MIIFQDVSKYYHSEKASVKDINLSIKQGEFVILIGHSGAGKTTLMHLLIAAVKPTSGIVTYDGVNIHKLRRADVPHYRQRIGVVFQDYKLLEQKTVFENLSFAMEMVGKSNEEIYENIPTVLDLVGLVDKEDHFPHQLSGGEQQRLAIARAIINEPDVLIADEPTDSLDPENVGMVIEVLRKINELGTTVILATHNQEVVKRLDKRIVRIEGGTIISDSSEEDK